MKYIDSQKGIASIIIALVFSMILVVVSGVYYFTQQQTENPSVADETIKNPSISNETTDWKTYRDENGFQLRVPLNVEKDVPSYGSNGTLIGLLGEGNLHYEVVALEEVRKDAENVLKIPGWSESDVSSARTFLDARTSGGILKSFEEFWAAQMCGSTESCPNTENISALEIGGYPAVQWSYIRHMQFSILTQEKIYRFWASFREEEFTEGKELLRTIVNTFKII